MPPTALVTGATAGIGLAFARRLAADGHDLVLVARDVDRLDAVADHLRTAYGHEVEVLGADLTDRAELRRVADRVADEQRPVEVLVNNAGFGLGDTFLGTQVADEERMLEILCRAVLVLSHAAAPAMVQRRRGAIINVSSVSSFVTIGTYSAAKAWATVFSEGLASELSPHGVTVTALCPGFVRTEFHQRAGITMSRLPAFAWLDSDDLVHACLADVGRGAVVSVPSLPYAALATLVRHLPRSVVRRVSWAVASGRSGR